MVADEILRLAAEGTMWERRTVVGGWKGSMAAACGVVWCGEVRSCSWGCGCPAVCRAVLSGQATHGRGMQAEVGVYNNYNALPP